MTCTRLRTALDTARGASVLLALAALLTLLAGCGGSSSSTKDARAEALSYIPRDSPLVAELTTDPKSQQIGAALDLIRSFPFGGALLSGVKSQLDQNSNYEQAIKPLLGNPFFVSPPITVGGAASELTVAFVARDAGKLSSTIRHIGVKIAEHKGFTIYRSDSVPTIGAVKGPVFLVSGDQAGIEAAIDRHDSKQGARVSDFDGLAAGLPAHALLRLSGDVGPLIAKTGGTEANRVPFVRALEGYATSLSLSSHGVAVDVRLDTGGAPLAPDERPLAAGDRSPPLLAGEPLVFGAQDVGHLLRFAIGVGALTDPTGYARFRRQLARLKSRSGVDLIEQISTQFSGPAQEAGDLHSFAARATAKDPAALRRDLAGLTPILKAALHARTLGHAGGLTQIGDAHGSLSFGVIGNQFVVGSASPATLARLASRPLTPLPGAHGTISLRVGLRQILAPLIGSLRSQGLQGQIAQAALQRIGNVTGYASEDANGLTAHFELGSR